MRITCLAVLLSLVVTASAAELPEGVRRMKVLNYADCFELSNAETRVTLCHQAGGRVLEYSFKGTNVLYLDPEEAKWGSPGGPRAPSSAGRFDIGPEYLIPKRDKLWSGSEMTNGVVFTRIHFCGADPAFYRALTPSGDFVQHGPNLGHHGGRNSAKLLTEKASIDDAQLKHEGDRWPTQVILRIAFNQDGARKTKRLQLGREWNEQNRGKLC